MRLTDWEKVEVDLQGETRQHSDLVKGMACETRCGLECLSVGGDVEAYYDQAIVASCQFFCLS